MRVLYIEDDPLLTTLVRNGLVAQGFVVDCVGCAEDGLAAVRAVEYSVVILDLNLPDADGMDVLAKVRQQTNAVPVLILSARGQTEARVRGLDAGADDYVAKPFAVDELAARVRALMRRRPVLPNTVRCGNLALDMAAQEVLVDGCCLTLSRREFAILALLIEVPGQVRSKAQIENALYGFGDEIASNAVEFHIHHLRRKLASAGAKPVIRTRRGFGYVLEVPQPQTVT